MQKSSAFYRLSIKNYFLRHKEEVLATSHLVILAMVPLAIQETVPLVTQVTFLLDKGHLWDQGVLGVQAHPQAQVTCHPGAEE